MKRVENWPTLLAAFIEERRDVPFTWGKADCCLFAADWVRLATDLDPAADLRGKYNSALGALRIIEDHDGLATLVARALIPLGSREVAISLACRGDIIVRDSENGYCAGVVLGKESAFVTQNGLSFVPTKSKADARAWKI